MGDVHQLIQQDLVGPVHRSISLIFTEVLVLPLQCVVVLDTLCLAVYGLLERRVPRDFLQLLFMVSVARIAILEHIGVIFNVSRGLHF